MKSVKEVKYLGFVVSNDSKNVKKKWKEETSQATI